MKWKQIKLPMKVNRLSPTFPFPRRKRFGFLCCCLFLLRVSAIFYWCLFEGPSLKRGINKSFISEPNCEISYQHSIFSNQNEDISLTNQHNYKQYNKPIRVHQTKGGKIRACVSWRFLSTFASYWFWKTWRENFQPITKQYNNQSIILFYFF